MPPSSFAVTAAFSFAKKRENTEGSSLGVVTLKVADTLCQHITFTESEIILNYKKKGCSQRLSKANTFKIAFLEPFKKLQTF